LERDREPLMMSAPSPIARAACVERDATDSLRNLRDRFVIPEGIIYLDGNSLGPMPRAAAGILNRTIEQEWGHDLIRSWNRPDGSTCRSGSATASER
jgi:kynureninase